MNAAETGRKLAELYDPDTQVPGVTTGMIDPALAPIGVPSASAGDTRLILRVIRRSRGQARGHRRNVGRPTRLAECSR